MLILPNSLKSLLGDRVHRFSTCWQITRVDGTVFRFTDHDRKLTVGGQTFTPVGGFDSSARQKRDALRGQDAEFRGAITSAAITATDLREGRYRGAIILERLVDWRYPWAGEFFTNKYFVTDVRYSGETWEVQIAGLTRLLETSVGDTYTRNCGFDLGDARCKFNLNTMKVSGVDVDSSADRRHFVATDAGFASKALNWFQFGEVTWLTGNNAGLVSEVNGSTAAVSNTITFELQMRTVRDIQAGDTCDLVPGCDKTFPTCKTKFSNGVNFGGFPFIPGTDKILQTPDT